MVQGDAPGKEASRMKINLDDEARVYLNLTHHEVLTVSADRECVGANCSEFVYPVIHYYRPDEKTSEHYDRFDFDGLTVFFDKQLETVPEVTLRLERHFMRDKIRIQGLPEKPGMTHHKI